MICCMTKIQERPMLKCPFFLSFLSALEVSKGILMVLISLIRKKSHLKKRLSDTIKAPPATIHSGTII